MKRRLLTLLLLWTVVPLAFSQSRLLIGQQNGQTIQLQTDIVQSREYVNAALILSFFQNRWKYDGLSETLIFFRPDGVRVGMQAGDPRIMVGGQVVHGGVAPLRRNGAFYIPFSIVNSHLFPNVAFQQTSAEEAPPTPTPPPDNRFLFSTPIPMDETPRAPVTRSPTRAPFTPAPTPTPLITRQPATQAVIVLDAGNDAQNPGYRAMSGGREWQITRSICGQVADMLRQEGAFEVVMTHAASNAQSLTNDQRTAIANRMQGDVFVSIQAGALASNSISYGAVYFMNDRLDAPSLRTSRRSPGLSDLQVWDTAYQRHVEDSVELARKLNQSLAQYYQSAGVVQMDDNPRPGRLAVLRGLTMPGALVELGNLANPQTARYLSIPQIQQAISDTLSLAILNFFYERTGMPGEGANP